MLNTALCLVCLVLTVGTGSMAADAQNSGGGSSKDSVTKQFGFPNFIPPQQPPFRFIPRRPNFPFRNVPIRQRQAVAQPPPSRSSDGVLFTIIYYVFSRMFTTTTTAAATTTTAATTNTAAPSTMAPCTVAWGTWTECFLNGFRYRSRTCPTGPETVQGVCFVDCLQWSQWTTCPNPMNFIDDKTSRTRQCTNGFQREEKGCHSSTTAGSTSDGWVRATNGYEYKYFGATGPWIDAVRGCETADARSTLATAGARSGFIKDGLDKTALGITVERYWVGGTDANSEGNWVFPDGIVLSESQISPWATVSNTQKPTSGNTLNCLYWAEDDGANTQVEGFGDISCSTQYGYLCERPVA